MFPGKFHLLYVALVLFMLLPMSGFSETLTKEQIESLFQEGNSLFHQAIELSNRQPWTSRELFLKAVLHYERIVYEGAVRNGKLFYNIGNAYFRTGDIGKAILFYIRAVRFIPNDQNLIQNLTYARSKRIDKIEEKQETKIFKTIFFWHYDFPAGMRFTIFLVCYIIIWICASLLFFIKHPLLKWGIIIPSICAVLFLGSLVIDIVTASKNNPGVILSQQVTARKGDSEAYEPSFQKPLHTGTEFNLIEQRREWYHIELSDGRSCWIPGKDAELARIE
jgi:tetratricopeptide (TPR) repeat protein